jgi:hypothetical protein
VSKAGRKTVQEESVFVAELKNIDAQMKRNDDRLKEVDEQLKNSSLSADQRQSLEIIKKSIIDDNERLRKHTSVVTAVSAGLLAP